MDTAQNENPRTQSTKDRGASVVEYALIVALLSVVSLGAITFASDSAEAMFDHVGDDIVSGSSGVPVAAPPAGGGDTTSTTSGGSPSTPTTTETTTPTTTTPTTTPTPTSASTTFSDVGSRWVYGDDWRSEATVVLRDENGLPVSDATVRVKVVTYEYHYGSWHYVDTDYENYRVDSGEVDLSHRYDEDDVERVVYEIVSVTFDDLDGPVWDEATTKVTINKP